jgi:23S rRNA (adenine2030-N6)-methyltransferase
LNYRHAYHAGSFTDVFKHVILTALMSSLSRKETPFCYIDTHAGIGYYDLFGGPSQKTKEYENGIERIIEQDNPPPLVKRYLDCVHKINNQLTGSKFSSLKYYPGSPMIARYLARPHDRIIACELQRQDYETLRSTFAGDKQVAAHHMDGFLGLKAFLPPTERRGFVLIDPPYENPDEFTRIAHSMPPAIKRWDTGIYAIWYPVKDKIQVKRFYRTLQENVKLPILSIELSTYPDLPDHLNGSGVAVINPPWQFEQSVNDVLPWLWKALTINRQGSYHASLLK